MSSVAMVEPTHPRSNMYPVAAGTSHGRGGGSTRKHDVAGTGVHHHLSTLAEGCLGTGSDACQASMRPRRVVTDGSASRTSQCTFSSGPPGTYFRRGLTLFPRCS